jgi:hypothetical protein
MDYSNLLKLGYVYIYRGDRYTDVQYKMKACLPVITSTGKCIRGKNGNMLVSFQSGTVVVLARQLRRLDKLALKELGHDMSPLKKVISNQLVLSF